MYFYVYVQVHATAGETYLETGREVGGGWVVNGGELGMHGWENRTGTYIIHSLSHRVSKWYLRYCMYVCTYLLCYLLHGTVI